MFFLIKKSNRMNRNPVLSCMLCICLLAAFNYSFSQSDTIRMGGYVYARVGAALPDMRAIYDNYAAPDLKENRIDIKAVRDFKKRYKDVSNVTWRSGTHGFN